MHIGRFASDTQSHQRRPCKVQAYRSLHGCYVTMGLFTLRVAQHREIDPFDAQRGSPIHGLRRAAVFVLRVIHMLLRELVGGQLNLRAMSLVYTTLLSIVPLLAVSFSVLKGFGFHQRLESYLFSIMLEPLGPSG